MKPLSTRLLDLLLVYEEEAARGVEPNLVRICAGDPDLLPAFLEALDQLQHFRRRYEVPTTEPAPSFPLDPQAPPSRPTVPGFAIQGEVGRGGMGIVYSAVQIALKRTVALKMILAGHLAGTAMLERFEREAEAVARLRHEGIVQIYEVGTWSSPDGAQGPYMALEYLPGGSLEKRLGGLPQPAREAAALVKALAEAMQHAHTQGVLHRDLKPANVLLTAEGKPKIADFGLARMLDRSEEKGTRTGAVLGTPAYMSPEQAGGESQSLGPATDIWALGVILYESLTGRPPFRGTTTFETLRMVREGSPVSPATLNPGVPRDLETICLKCLQKEPGRRYGGAGELAADLERFLQGKPIHARPTGQMERAWKWVKRNPVVFALSTATLTVLVVGIVVSWWYANEAIFQAGEARTNAQTANENAVAAQRAQKEAESNLWRAEELVYAGKLALAQRALSEGDRVQALEYLEECQWDRRGWEHRHLWKRVNSRQTLQHRSVVFRAAWTLDGKQIITGSDDGMVTFWDVATGRKIGQRFLGQNLRALGWSPDGKRILGGTVGDSDPRLGRRIPSGVTVWDTASGQELLALKGLSQQVFSAGYSPDEKWIVTGGGNIAQGKRFPGELKLWNAETGAEVCRFQGHTLPISSVAFSPDGRRILSGGGNLNLREENLPPELKLWDAATGQELRTFQGNHLPVLSVAYSLDGKRVLAGGGNHNPEVRFQGEVTVWDTETGRIVLAVPELNFPITCVDFSPDGKLVVAANSEEGKITLWETETGREVNSFRGNRGSVMSVTFSPDGKQILTGEDHTAKVWDIRLDPGAVVIQGHDRVIHAVAYSPRGPHIATGSADATVKVWNVETGGEHLTLRGHTAAVLCVAWSPDGHHILSGSEDGTARVWQAETGNLLRTLQGHKSRVHSVAFSPDGQHLLTGGEDGTARIWNLRDGEEVRAFLGQAGLVRSVTWSPDGRQVLTGHDDNTARLWDAFSGRQIRTLSGHSDSVSSVAWSLDGRCLLTGSFDRTAVVWDAHSGERLVTLAGHQDGLSAACFSPDGQRIVTGSSDKTVRIWHAETGQLLLTVTGNAEEVGCVAFSPDGQSVLTVDGSEARAGRAGIVRVWHAARGPQWKSYRGHDGPVRSVYLRPDGTRILSGGDDGKVILWDAVKGQERFSFRTHTSFINSVEFSPNGKRFLTGGGAFDFPGMNRLVPPRTLPGEAAIWDADTGRRLLLLEVSSAPVLRARWSPDGKRILVASGNGRNQDEDGVVKIFDAEQGREILTLEGHKGLVTCVAFSPDGKRVAAAYRGQEPEANRPGGMLIWDAETGQRRLSIRGDFFFTVKSLAFSPDGKYLLTGGESFRMPGGEPAHEAIVWNSETGASVLMCAVHRSPINCVAYSQDGKWILTGSEDRTARIWDAQTGRELYQFGGHRSGVRSLACSLDGKRLVTGCDAGTVRIWEVK